MGLYVVYAQNEALAAAAETMIQIVAPSTHRLEIVRWSVALDGVTASNVPGDVELLRQTTAGTASAFTPKKLDEADPAPQATAQTIFTAEPTAGDILDVWHLTPNGGALEVVYDEGYRPIVAASGRIGLRATFANAVNVMAKIWYKE